MKPRRVRVCTCPRCGKVTPVGRRWPDPDLVRLTVCACCFEPFESETIDTWLEMPPLTT